MGFFSSCGDWSLLLLQSMGSAAQAQLLWSTGLVAPWIFPDQGSNLCLLHWQVNSLPLSHQGSPQGYKNNERKERLFHPLMQKSNFSATETSAEQSIKMFVECFPLMSCTVQLCASCYSVTAES